MTARVSIIVLNWNNASDTLECLRSLSALDYPDCEVLVVDNCSTDDSASVIRANFPGANLLETRENLGYAGGNNVAVRQALASDIDYICILNNDVTVEPDFLTPLIAVLENQPDVGVATPLVAERDQSDSRVWALGAAVNWHTAEITRQHTGEPVNYWRQQVPFDVEIVSGAALLVKREIFERVGLMDETFFLYYEEVDWSLNVRTAGYGILAVPSSVVWHGVSATLGTSSPVIDYYMVRNHLRLISRHWSGLRRGCLWGRVILRNLLAVAAFTVKSQNGQRTPNRNARLFGMRDAILGRWSKMGPDAARICYPEP